MVPLRALRRTRAILPRSHHVPLFTSSRTSQPPGPGILHSNQHNDNDGTNPVFTYTTGRFLWNEASQLRERYQPFNIAALKTTAARSVNAKSCISIAKLPEGSYNKAFLLTMPNNVQVIAKIPNPYIRQKFATASEVATLDFLRNEVGVPAPRVFAWSGEKENPVGVEYIIMEKAAGSELSRAWPSMDVSGKVDIVAQLASIQLKKAAVDFGCYGSLFYEGDIEGGVDVPGIADRFCIGPSCGIRFWEGERRSMSGYRGPWSSSTSYALDITRREKEWIKRFAKPRHPADSLRQSDSQESPDHHINILNKYGLNRSVLWHADLHPGNIFLKDNQITSIIDWQFCSTLPLFHDCRIPKFLKIHNGGLLFDLPSATGLTAQQKEDNLQRYQLTQLQQLYISKFRDLDNDIFSALSFPQASTRQQLIDFAGYTWDDDGLYLFQEMLLRTWREWAGLTGQPQSSCPVAFRDDELAFHVAEGRSWEDRRELFAALGVPMDGWVHAEDFEAKVEAMRDLVRSIIDAADDEDGVREALRAWKLSESGPASLSRNLMDI
ncbi:phosphotransferase enzyme family protein [Aspergillus karnatakaensis]|uniref:phosphotransferase enzyme family protein n=1 Tax=Aspergillus karnatakaensis TaxID=1810916 RepID=UPI003CCDCAD2